MDLWPVCTRRRWWFGAVAAGWSVLTRLGIAGIVDEVVGPRRSDAGAAERFTRIRRAVLDHRRAWDATHGLSTEELAEIERRVSAAMVAEFDLDISAVTLDMTNFATFIDFTDPSASLAQRGKAKQKRADLRLTWHLDDDARSGLENEVFGKRVLVTNRETWPITDVVAAYRSQSDAEFGFRQLEDPHVVSFSPLNHWTDQVIRVRTYTCVLALQLAHLMRRQATQAGLPLSVRALLDTLAEIQETVLIHPSTGGRPKPAGS